MSAIVDGFEAESAAVFRSVNDPVVVARHHVDELIAAARLAPAKRARLILHTNVEDRLHEMVIALPSHSCLHPHINDKSDKSFLALSGQFALMRFSDDGSQVDAVILSAGSWPGGHMVRLRAPAWHTIIPLAGDTVFLETIVGPFAGNRFAGWFPGEDDVLGREAFAERLRGIARAKTVELERRERAV
jgi:cupin fold WbuC family metalloprotein